jgi:hypothetical protein
MTVIDELRKLSPEVAAIAEQRDGAARLVQDLPARFLPRQVANAGDPQRTWELAGLFYFASNRFHEALGIFWGLYQHMLASQDEIGRIHKGTPLVWVSDSFKGIGCPVHSKRYLLLTLCEDALREKGNVSPENTGSYFRIVWGGGLPDREFRRYASTFWELAEADREAAMFPEALLQRVDDEWITEIPSAAEAFVYQLNERYVLRLLRQLGTSSGEALELLAEYLLSCMPGCRTRRRARSGSTDYDVVCSMEGFDVDFRSELGRYFVCECKDWNKPADFTTMAKFCRVLDSFKARFGILFSKFGISGEDRTTDAVREQLKVFQDRGIVIIVVNLADLQSIAAGRNFISLLRTRYQAVRLDIQ